MFSIPLEGPAVEPVSLADMKAYLRVDDDAEDDLITGLIKAARLIVEAVSRRILIAQNWRVMLDRWPQDQTVLLPLSPLLSVESVKVFDASGVSTEVTIDSIESDLSSDPPRLIVRSAPNPGRARNGIAIDVRVGYGDSPDSVPATLRLAIKIVVAHWFENRGDVAGDQVLPAEALALIAPFQRARL
ncbi:head-tail connector protein [Microvirga alba]|uniref:Phage head-tail connector protein n=1 Tax=Microvirga alba TaxID=2791025 RepID=A0A931BM62_9HYPH|nr:head-tail connector protein [Microvirga alba]MBF9232059.1 phage head-tail connector protein [Microvirga alba]